MRKSRFEVVPLASIATLLGNAEAREKSRPPRPRKILWVARDTSLTTIRCLLFSGAGFQVTSALTIADAFQHCGATEFALVVIGHTIPLNEKKALLELIQKGYATPVLALYSSSEGKLEGADYVFDSSKGPLTLLDKVKDILQG
jgi:hypothetical protein